MFDVSFFISKTFKTHSLWYKRNKRFWNIPLLQGGNYKHTDVFYSLLILHSAYVLQVMKGWLECKHIMYLYTVVSSRSPLFSQFPVGTCVKNRQKAGMSHDGSATCESVECISRLLYGNVFMEHCKVQSRNVQGWSSSPKQHELKNKPQNKRIPTALPLHVMSYELSIISMYYIPVYLLL